MTLAVIGGGIVGLACAVTAQQRGHAVTLIDRAEPGYGCSLGNAGIIAASEIFPLITPARVRQFPKMLLSREAAAVIRMNGLARTLPWMARSLPTLSPSRQSAITSAIVSLNAAAVSAWRDLLEDCGTRHLLREKGMIRLIRDASALDELIAVRDRLAEHGLSATVLSGDEVREIEPQLGSGIAGGLLHHSDADISDPLQVSRALFARFTAAGGQLIREEAFAVRPTRDGAEIALASGLISVSQVVVASGLSSGELLRPLGVQVPLQAERGYHLMLDNLGSRLSRPVTFHQDSCVGTPMGDALRLAGTVEFAAADAPPDWSRADRLARYAARYFAAPFDDCAVRRWMGGRPSLPDSLPAIGRLQTAPAIAYAFGHQHLGVTQAAITARLLCDMIAGDTLAPTPSPYRIERFQFRG